MKHKAISFLTAALMLSSAVTVPPVQAEDDQSYNSVIGTLPDWTPTDFVSAMKLFNSHGKCYLADEYICMVRPVLKSKKDSYGYLFSGSMTYINTPAGTGRRILELDIPEKPDPDDTEAFKAYEAYCDSIGLYSHDYSFFESYAGDEDHYVFDVEMFHVLDGLDLNIMCYETKGEENIVTDTYTFENHDGTTVQTDIYSWLPDCTKEVRDFYNKYGTASVHDSYIAFVSDINRTTGESLLMTQSGDGAVEEYMTSSAYDFELVPMDGVTPPSVILYKPVADGNVDISWKRGRRESETDKFIYDGTYEIKDNCTVINDRSHFRKGNTVFTFIDSDTGELISEKYLYSLLSESSLGAPSLHQLHMIESNPCTIDDINAYSPEAYYSFDSRSGAGNYGRPVFEVTDQDNSNIYVTCRLTWEASGDTNGDDEFGVADAVLLMEWLLGRSDADIKDWNSADLCRDNTIDTFDFCLMRQKLIKGTPVIKEPEEYVTNPNPFYIIGDDPNLYSGPGTEYPVIDVIPAGTWLEETGYNKGNNNWVYTEYINGAGWINMLCSDGISPNVRFALPAVDKPVIYLYPEKETDVRVELELTESVLSTTYPRYNGGWDVTAYPDGSLLNKADGTHHRYLFWDSTNCRTRFDLSKGFCIAGSDTESFLREKLTYMGLTEEEMNEFIVYWLPRMEHNKYNLIAFQGDAYTESAKLKITPEPDSLLRIFMTYIPLENAVETEPQQLETFERKGFTVVEWGGSELTK